MTKALVAANHTTYGGVYYCSEFTISGAQPTWTKLTTTGLPNTELLFFGVDPNDPINKHYVEIENSGLNEIYYRDGGDWSKILDTTIAAAASGYGPANYNIFGLFVDPTTGYVYCQYGYTQNNDGNADHAVMRSINNGANWSAISFKAKYPTSKIEAIGNYIWIVSRTAITGVDTLCVYDISGETWVNSVSGNGSGSFNIRINPQTPNECYHPRLAANLYKHIYSGGSIGFADTGLAAAGSYGQSTHWIDDNPDNIGLEIIQDGNSNYIRTYNAWDTFGTVTLTVSGPNTGAQGITGAYHDTTSAICCGDETGGAGAAIYALSDETDTSWAIRSGSNYGTVPYTDSIPKVGYVSVYGIWFGDAPASTGVNVFSVEEGDISSMPSYDGLGVPMFGDRASFRDLDVDGYADYHAEDIQRDTPQRHLPWGTAGVTSGYGIVSNGTVWVGQDIATQDELDNHAGSANAHHNPITLATDADTFLGLNDQEINLDVQSANTIFAGPVSGLDADPTFRALVLDDLPITEILTGELLVDDSGATDGSAILHDDNGDVIYED